MTKSIFTATKSTRATLGTGPSRPSRLLQSPSSPALESRTGDILRLPDRRKLKGVAWLPGTMMFLARSPGHSFDHAAMNMSHVVHAYMFGAWLYGKKYRTMARMHPGGIEKFWGDKMIKN
eukprot:scaffold198657_cov32-Prasinocladus_malaysianus.AAC.1